MKNLDRLRQESPDPEVIVLPMSPSINRTYGVTRTGIFYKKGEAKDWEKEAQQELMLQWRRKPYIGKIYLGIDLFFKQESDIGNRDKILEDVLQGKVYENDRQIYQKNVRKFFDTKNPRIEITVRPLK